MIGSRLGPYEITARIGAGGMGEVYRATDTRLGRDVALKVLPSAFSSDAERRARFEREARLLASLNHPNIAQVYGFETAGQAGGSDLHFLGMELVEGEDLAERLKRGPIPLDEAIAIAKQIAEALEEAHDKGIVHRDLKPANVKVTSDGKVKVLDFGLAKAWEGDRTTGSGPDLSQSPTLAHTGTQAGIILGTAAYMSPEQARGKTVDKRADIWAFGVVLFEMLSGRQLFAGETVSDTLAAVLRQEIDWAALPAGTPEALKHLLRRCLERDPKLRLRDIGDARHEIHEAAAHPAPSIESTILAPVRGRAAWMVVTAVAAGVLLVGLAVGRWLSGSAPGRGPMRVLIEPPAGTAFHDVPVISPDGRAVAFLARATEGSPRLGLFVQKLAGAAERLGAVEFSTLDIAHARPFWSPDSSAVAFCDGQQLRVAPLNGGAVRALALCDRSWRGGAWGEGDVILFVPDSNSAVLAIPAAGGTARPVSAFDANVPDLSHRFPRFLPGGRRFLYLAWSNAAGAAEQALGLFIGDLDSGRSRKLSDARGSAEYVGTGDRGRVLLRRDRNLVAVALDTRALELSGSETLVEPAVAFDGNTGYTFVSATPRGDIVLAQPDTSLAMSNLGWVDRRGTDQNAIKVPARYVDITVAPSGRMLAAEIADPARGVNDIWVIDLEREVATRLTQGRDHSSQPVWHPDGRRIAFTSEESGNYQPYIVMADRSSPPARLAETGHRDAIAAFAPDGEWLILERSDQRAEIWARSVRDGREVPICQRSGGACGEPAVSPDGRLLAYVADDSGRREVYVRPFMSEGGQVQVSAAGGRRPHWRSDGRELVYRDLEGWTTAVPISADPELRAGTPQRLMVQAIDTLVVPAPDHSRFLTTTRVSGGAAMARLLLDWR